MIGHNDGPPIGDVGEAAGVARRYYWRRAHAAAWRTPPVEIIQLRSRAAENVGLSYRDYTSILLNRGRRPCALVFSMRALLRARNGTLSPMPGVQRKLQRLGASSMLFVVAREREPLAQGASLIDGLCRGIKAHCLLPETVAAAAQAVAGMLAEHGLPPGQALFVGESLEDERCAAAADVARFLWAWHYFSEGAAPAAVQ